ncbi:MAG TPA: hypothetical protein VIL42_09905 [Sphingomicrobium sp.]
MLPLALDFELLAPDFEALLRDRDAPLPDAFDALPRDEDELDFELRDEPDDDAPPLDRPELPRADELEPPLPDSPVHLPLITRWAASATASAIIEPSLVALDRTLPAARSAVSAASRPASRIFLRAAGLALIAAAAAARPAASISLLIAALASLSTVFSEPEDPCDEDLDELEPEEDFRADLAIFSFPSVVGAKDTLKPFRFPNEVRTSLLQIM